MSERVFMGASAVVSVLFGIIGATAAAPIAAAVGLGGEPTLVLAARLLSASYIGYAVTDWMGRGTRDPVARRAIRYGNFTGWALSSQRRSWARCSSGRPLLASSRSRCRAASRAAGGTSCSSVETLRNAFRTLVGAHFCP